MTPQVSEEVKADPVPADEGTKGPRPKRQDKKGKRPEKAEKATEEQKPAAAAGEEWKLPAAEGGDWGATADSGWGAESQEANAPTKSPTSARSPGGWANGTPTEGTDPNKPFKRVPAYVNADRVKTGGSERTKLSEEELAKRMEKMRLQNEKIKEKRLEVDADAERFEAEQAELKKRQDAQARIQNDVNKERQKIAEKKVALAQRREWDSGKPGIGERQDSFEERGRGRGRGRGGRGRGRGAPSEQEGQKTEAVAPSENPT